MRKIAYCYYLINGTHCSALAARDTKGQRLRQRNNIGNCEIVTNIFHFVDLVKVGELRNVTKFVLSLDNVFRIFVAKLNFEVGIKSNNIL